MLPLLILVGAVALDVDVPTLRGRIALLLLDESLDVYGPRARSTPTRVEVDGDVYTLTIELDAPIRVEVTSPVPAVAELELAQRIVLATRDRAGSQTSQPLIYLDVRGPVSIPARALAVARLLDSSFGLTNDVTRATEGRCLTIVDGRAHVRHGPLPAPCAKTTEPSEVRKAPASPARTAPPDQSERVIPTERSAPTAPVRTATIAWAAPLEPPSEVSLPKPEIETATAAEDVRPEITNAPPVIETAPADPPKVRWPIRVGVTGAMTGRAHGFDPTVAIDADLKRNGWGLRVGGLLLGGGRAPIRVWELVLAAGPAAELLRFGAWTLDVAVLVGAHRHDFRFEATGGARWDLAVDLPATLLWKPVAPLMLGVSVRPGLDSRARQHVQAGEVLWERGAFRVTAGISLGVEFEN